MKLNILVVVILCLGLSCEEGLKNSSENTYSEEESISNIISYKKLDNFASGSGMAHYNNYFYIVGDDDPYLAKLNEKGEILQRWQLWDTNDVQNGRINKKVKPDFEAISYFPFQQDTLLLIFGSGSKSPKRDVIFTFNPKKEEIDTLDGESFFAWLKETADLTDDEVNLEGAAFHNGYLYLLNRHNNEMYMFPESGFRSFIKHRSTEDLTLEGYRYELPVYKNDSARFSGASILSEKNQILFSATIETTDNWEDDGKILGSFMGRIDLNNLKAQKPFCEPIFIDDTTRFQGKIEALHGIKNDKNLHIYFITDDDDGSTGWGEVKMAK